MPRGRRVTKKMHDPDPIYNNRLLTRFINRVMKQGKKRTAQRMVYGALEEIKAKGHDPVQVFEKAVQNIGPRKEVRTRRVGGASYQVPVDVRGDRRIALSLRWLVQYANSRSSKEYKTFSKKLAAELMDAFNNEGEAVKRKDTMHRMADANKAFSHFRW